MEKEKLEVEKTRIASLIRQEREKLGMSKYKLAIKSGVHRSLITNLEDHPHLSYKVETLIALTSALNMVIVGKLLPNEQITEDSKACALALHP